jgi:CRISPR-associated protein Cas2
MSNKLIITYDISDDRLRTKFSKYLSKFGHRLQYSVFEIKNSPRILDNIKTKIIVHFEKRFKQADSVIIFHLSSSCEKICFGYAKNEDSEILIV